ncbi:acyl-CoA dehydrogenase family protein [Blastomonas sp.]|jgi:alkylation response protein AidB-like acyl-CoA dehydrogenase|uniref:acyl-CoA dehydrogenase family protein n=1 Tax=Blastomonas sp. TaxID=1909299 RepID=UPI00406A1225
MLPGMVEAALQLHGGTGYRHEYPIARFWRDASVTRLFGWQPVELTGTHRLAHI